MILFGSSLPGKIFTLTSSKNPKLYTRCIFSVLSYHVPSTYLVIVVTASFVHVFQSAEFRYLIHSLDCPVVGRVIHCATIRILTTEGFTYFDNAKQLSRFIGICPTYQQSRTSVNIREHINRNDDERLRSLLYIAFWTALRYNSRECYIRLKANEKPFKVALIAVTNKLVRPVLTITTINSIYRWICPG